MSPDSVISTFLDRVLPGRRTVTGEWRGVLARAPAAGLAVDRRRDVVGRAFEMRVGLDLAGRPGYYQLLAFLPARQCEALLRAAGFDATSDNAAAEPMIQAWERVAHPNRADDPAQREALSSCFDVAQWDRTAHDVDWPVQWSRNAFTLIPQIKAAHQHKPEATSALMGLMHLWRNYMLFARRRLLELGSRVVLEPQLAPGFATGDLIVGRTMVEVKTYLDPFPYLERWLDQLLAYVLLDRWNIYCLTDIALLAGWQAAVCRASIDAVLQAGSPGGSPTLEDLRAELEDLLHEDLGLALRSHMHRRFPPPHDAWTLASDLRETPPQS